MSKEFTREARYVVLKNADIMQCLTVNELIALRRIEAKVGEHRAEIGKPPLECVVVEADWPEYEPTWKAIEARVAGERPAPNVSDNWPIHADPFAYVIQHLNSNPYPLTKDETITFIKELRALYNAAPEAKP